jgi:hypothetical protein
MSQVSIITFVIFTFTASSAFAGLAGFNWYSDENYVRVIGRTQRTSNTKFCSTFFGKLECKVTESGKPDYYLLECDRNRRVCTGVQAVILPPGEPWLAKVEYRIGEWNHERVFAIMSSMHPCVVTTLQIDLDSKEVVFTETYTKSVKDDPICIPENIGHTTTYRLENY